MTATPEQLFAQFRAHGDPDALGALFDRASPQLLSLALHLCGNPADAEDSLQATFVTAIARAASWDASRPVLPWLGGILSLQCKKVGERRARRREAELVQPELLLDDGSPVEPSERRELVGKLREHIGRLPQDQRQVLLLQLEHGLSPAEVGEVLGVPPGTVRMRLHRAVKALRGVMPAGLVALMLAALPTRGVAAVRAAVLASAATGVGALLLKKVLIAVAVLVVLAVGWTVSLPSSHGAEPGASAAAATVATGIERAAAPPSAPPTEGEERVPAPITVGAIASTSATTGSLRVQISYQGSGAAVPNVPIHVYPVRSDLDPRFEFTAAVTGVDGSCTLEGLTPGLMSVESIGGLRECGEVLAGEVATVELMIDPKQAPLTRVRGRVVHRDGRAAGGATITAASQGRLHNQPIGVADAKGWFEVQIARGFLLVGARLAGFAPSASRSFDGVADIQLVLPGPGATVAGVVVDAEGKPVPNAAIEIGERQGRDQRLDPGGWLEESVAPQHHRTDLAGHFVATDLPAEPSSVMVAADSFAPFDCNVNPVAGESLVVRWELTRGGVLNGRLVDEAGAPVVGVFAVLGSVYRTTDRDGRFGVRNVAAGPLWLRVEGEGLVTKTYERSAEAVGEWIVTAQRERQFLLRFVDENAAPLVGWQIELRAANTRMVATDRSGRAKVFEAAGGVGPLWLAPPGGIHAVMPWPLPAGLQPEVETTIVVPTSAQPTAVLLGTVLGPDGAPLADAVLEVRDAGDSYLYRQRLEAGRFRFERVPAGDWVVAVHRAGRGSAGGCFPVRAVQPHEVRDLGGLQLPREGSLQVNVVLADGSAPREASIFLFDAEGREHHAPPRDGQPHPWPIGHYRWKVMEDASLWESGELDVRAEQPTNLDVVLRPAVLRYVEFPLPLPAWGEPNRVDFVLRAPDGSVYDQGDFDPREELPYRYMPPLCLGLWRLELSTNDGRRFVGAFELASLAASREPIRIGVQPAR